MKFEHLFKFTDRGIEKFKAFCRGEIAEVGIDLNDNTIAVPVLGTTTLRIEKFDTSKAMAMAIKNAFGSQEIQDHLNNTGLWCWLTFVLKDCLFKRDKDGSSKFGALDAWFPASPNDFQKAQRHKVRMPAQMYAQFGKDADHALCGRPDTPGEVREQCTSQQGMFTRTFQMLCRALYYDEDNLSFKRGAGTKGAGTPRRLAQVVNQLQVTWDIHSFEVKDWLEKIPPEFDRFR
ncbi:hypothetical protein [Lentilitoribacter sp. EG35]|uniref:hypothetical protein n=1 Tax=Lentilitoribacter sp. EG35 TaxID=3234192 RepID=UPI00345F4B56